MKAIAIIGYHHTGKTTAVTALVTALTARGHRVATIKDIHSEKFRADTAGTNSALHVAAGSIQTVARGLYDTAVIHPRPLPLSEIVPGIEADFLIIEGMKDAPMPKIICAEDELQLQELIDDCTIGISGKISDTAFTHPQLPVFSAINAPDDLCKLVLEKSFEILPVADPECCQRCGSTCLQMAADIVQGRRSRQDCVLDGKRRLRLFSGGKEVVIVPFVQEILQGTIMAIVDKLRDIPNKDKIEIRIDSESD